MQDMDIQNCYRPLNKHELYELSQAKQVFSDCYLVSSIHALCGSDEGQKIIKEQVQKSLFDSCPKYKIRFNNVYGEAKDVFVTSKEVNFLQPTDLHANPIFPDTPPNKTLKAIELAMGKLIEKYPLLKSFVNRIPKCSENFEYNNPSRFMKIFTGKEPLSVNENTIYLQLSHKKKDALKLLKEIEQSEGQHSFVAGTSVNLFPELTSWHCYVVKGVNPDTKKVRVCNPRTMETVELSLAGFLNHFKFLTGFLFKNMHK